MTPLNKYSVCTKQNFQYESQESFKTTSVDFSKPCCMADLANRDTDPVWNISEKLGARISDIWSRMKTDNISEMRKLPEVFYRGVTLHFSDGKSLFIFKGVAVLRDGALIEIKKDRSRSLEKKILYSAPDRLIPDVVFDIEFCIDPPRYKTGYRY